MDFHNSEDDPLQAALSTAFSDTPIIESSSASKTAPPPVPEPAPDSELEAQNGQSGTDDSWKEDYDHLLSGWRAESAVQREHAEKERERWRRIREEEALKRPAPERKDSEWESVPLKTTSSVDADNSPRTPSPADARDLVTGERSNTSQKVNLTESRPDPPQYPSPPWEEVPSLDSSFPSLSFPDHSHSHSHSEAESHPHPQPPPQPTSVTLAVFDSRLSTRTRTLALISSLAINLLLPFINGVMLGFGEIFAKNIVGYFGWSIPGTSVGIRAAPRRKKD